MTNTDLDAAEEAIYIALNSKDADGTDLTEMGCQTLALCAIAHSLIAIAKSLP